MPDKDLKEKLHDLEENLRSLGSVAVAFSGGVDSTLLLSVAHSVLGDKALAVTCRNAFVPEWEFSEASEFCQSRGIPHVIVDIDPLADENCRTNPPDRCYWCKTRIFTAIGAAALDRGIRYVAEGSNMDDIGDYRPGLRAIEALGVLSPLRSAGLTKAEIRALSREMGLPTWSKPTYACLASRIAYNEEITPEKLRMVEQAETFLMSLGFTSLRVRMHGTLARIEVPAGEISAAASLETRSRITEYLTSLGFTYVTLDLRGFRSGSMNSILAAQDKNETV